MRTSILTPFQKKLKKDLIEYFGTGVMIHTINTNRELKVYYRMISGIDDEIGELRKVLEEKGFMDTNRKWNVLLSVFSTRRDGWNNYGSIIANFYKQNQTPSK